MGKRSVSGVSTDNTGVPAHPALTLTVLGCSGSYPAPAGACSGYLVSGGGVKFVVDMGPGTLANLQRHVGLNEIDAVMISHSHPDHWTDLAGLRTALKYGLGIEGLRVFGTNDSFKAAEALCVNLAPTIEWVVVGDGDAVSIGGLSLQFSRTDHYVETLALRIDHDLTGSSIAYSADTGTGWSLARLGYGFDLAICESTYPTDAEVEGVLHLSASQAGAMAAAAGAHRLVLTHLWPGSDRDEHERQAADAFGGAVDVAFEGAVYEVG